MRDAWPRPLQWLVFALLILLALLAAWRLVGQMQAERYAHDAPGEALQWRPDDPDALLQLAQQKLAQKIPTAATHTAQHLLAVAPLNGPAYRVLAQAADNGGAVRQAQVLFDIATRRAPRDLPTHTWLAQQALRRGNYSVAMQQLDFVLRQQPDRLSSLAPILVQLAQTPAFADALAASLHSNPPWRASMLQTLQTPDGNSMQAKAQARVMQSLQAQGGLSQEEFGLWLDSLMAQGRWGEAYARWAGVTMKPGASLPVLFNGDFRLPITNTGFDWRQQDVPSVLATVDPAASGKWPALHLQLLDRAVPEAGWEHVLLLTPGRYRLSMQLRAQSFSNALGLHWVIACDRGPQVLAMALPADGSFDWRTASGDFEIPAAQCQGQRLKLINPVGGGAGQRASGELWFAKLRIDREPS